MRKRRGWAKKIRSALARGKPRPARRLKIRHVTVPKWRTGTLSKAELTLYDDKHRPLIAMRMQRRRPENIQFTEAVLKKNPNKIIIDQIKLGSYPLQVYYYRNNPFYFYIAYQGEIIQVPTDMWAWFRRVFRKKPPL